MTSHLKMGHLWVSGIWKGPSQKTNVKMPMSRQSEGQRVKVGCALSLPKLEEGLIIPLGSHEAALPLLPQQSHPAFLLSCSSHLDSLPSRSVATHDAKSRSP